MVELHEGVGNVSVRWFSWLGGGLVQGGGGGPAVGVCVAVLLGNHWRDSSPFSTSVSLFPCVCDFAVVSERRETCVEVICVCVAEEGSGVWEGGDLVVDVCKGTGLVSRSIRSVCAAGTVVERLEGRGVRVVWEPSENTVYEGVDECRVVLDGTGGGGVCEFVDGFSCSRV